MTLTTKLAMVLVRCWTRLYTSGLPPELRTARRAEIDSDLWELEHDPDPVGKRGIASQILARLVVGLPDDLAWRMEVTTISQGVPLNALAAAGVATGPRRVSAMGVSATIHLIGITAWVWLTAHGYLYWRTPLVVPQAEVGFVEDLAAAEAGPSEFDPSDASAQATGAVNRFIETLLQNRFSLSVTNAQLSGTGATVLQSALAQSQFVLLGEKHGLPQIPQLGTAICNAGGGRFRTMAIEEGPIAASHLQQWAREPDGSSKLAAFKSKSPDFLHIYSSPQEFEMLQQCAGAAQGELRLWGLNEEEAHRTPPSVELIRQREQLMKTRFASEYAQLAGSGASPAILLKFGAFHVYRAVNPAGGFGIGNYVAGFAEKIGARSLHIQMVDTKASPSTRHLQSIVSYRLPADWTLFDLRPLRRDFNTLAGRHNTDLATLVFGIDMLVVVGGN
ncbi:MAG TPA: hypothetical protein VJ691_07085 [Vicinamibacterales bacterium]|nr:hypothetical protein [Vicinamibacterales bacterium]